MNSLTVKHLKNIVALPDASDKMNVLIRDESDKLIGHAVLARIDRAGQLVLTVANVADKT